jgi:hypothetical protein
LFRALSPSVRDDTLGELVLVDAFPQIELVVAAKNVSAPRAFPSAIFPNRFPVLILVRGRRRITHLGFDRGIRSIEGHRA